MRLTTWPLPIQTLSSASSSLRRCLSISSIRTRPAPLATPQRIPSHPAQHRLQSSSSMSSPSFSADSTDTTPALVSQLAPLVESGRWQKFPDGNGVERTFRFKTFKAAWSFMNAVAEVCKKERHHPEWTNVYNRVHVRWTTHDPPGLSGKDILLARICDELAVERGEVVESGEEKESDEGMKKMTDDAVGKIGGGCCVPKSRQPKPTTTDNGPGTSQ